MKNKEKEVWNGKGLDWYLDSNKKPKERFSKKETSDFEFQFIDQPKEILEIGVGIGRDLKRFELLGSKLNGIDISDKFIEIIKENFNGNFVVGDARNIVNIFNGKKFDLIYARWSLIHLSINELSKLLKKIHLILNENGQFLASLRYGFNYNAINKTTRIRSLELNEKKLIEILPNNLKVDKAIIKKHQSTESINDKQFTFILSKKHK